MECRNIRKITREWQSPGFGLFPLLVPLFLDIHRGPASRLFHDLVAFLASLRLLNEFDIGQIS